MFAIDSAVEFVGKEGISYVSNASSFIDDTFTTVENNIRRPVVEIGELMDSAISIVEGKIKPICEEISIQANRTVSFVDNINGWAELTTSQSVHNMIIS